MNDPVVDSLERALEAARVQLGEQDAAVRTEIGYALKALAQWRSLDMPAAQRRSVIVELQAAAEECLSVMAAPELAAALRESEAAVAAAAH